MNRVLVVNVNLKKLVKFLETRVNRTSYVFSGDTPQGWDCSGLVRWTYEQIGVELPHSATAQAHLGKRVHQPRIGDIVVFAKSGRTDFYHSAIYVGNNKIVNANKLYKTTIIESLNDFRGDQIRYIEIGQN
jgi:cell wall-associated NlpC family hydrolase